MALIFADFERRKTSGIFYTLACCDGLAMDLLGSVARELKFEIDLYLVVDGYFGSRNVSILFSPTHIPHSQILFKGKLFFSRFIVVYLSSLVPHQNRLSFFSSSLSDYCNMYMCGYKVECNPLSHVSFILFADGFLLVHMVQTK